MSFNSLHVMILEDESAHVAAISRELEAAIPGVVISVTDSLAGFRDQVARNPPHIALLDFILPDGRSTELLSNPPEDGPFPLIIMTSHGNESIAVDAIKRGAFDYIVKSRETFTEIPRILARSLREWRLLLEQKRVKLELEESRTEWERTFDAITDPIMILDRNFAVKKVNKAMAEVFGKSESQGMICWKAFHGGEAPPADCPCMKLLSDGQQHTEEFHDIISDSYYQISAYPVLDKNGMVDGAIHVARDITLQKNLEEKLRHSQKLDAIGTLSGGIAHDFNNVLTAISGFAALLDMNLPEDDPMHNYVDEIMSASERAAGLTRSLLAFSRTEMMEARPVNLNKVIGGVARMLDRLIREDIEIRMNLSSMELPILAESNQIEHLIINMTTNARDAMPEGGELVIATKRFSMDNDFVTLHGFGSSGEYALLTVSDTGTGIDPKHRERIFEPFFTTKDVGAGTGLGLSVCYGIIKQHKGYINCNSEPGVGTTFRIYFPLLHGREIKQEDAPAEKIVGGSETILLAEDDTLVRGLVVSILENVGYRVIEAENGLDAVEKFSARGDEVDLCMFDVMMPKKKGSEAFEDIRKLKPGVRGILMSGYASQLLDKIAGDENVVCMTKPIVPRELLKMVRTLLDR